jgi:hypothetical protein
MIAPALSSWVEEWDELAAHRINCGDVRAFVCIAPIASQRKIVQCGGSFVLLRPDVVNFKRRESQCGLWQATVFANSISALPN